MRSYFIDGPSRGSTLALHTDSDGNPVSNMVTCVLSELDPISVVNAGDPVSDSISFTQTVYYFVGCIGSTAFYTVHQSNQINPSRNCIEALCQYFLELRPEREQSNIYGMVGQEFVGVPRLGNELPMDQEIEAALAVDPGDIGSQGTQTGPQTQVSAITRESIEEAVRALSDSMPRPWTRITRGPVFRGPYFHRFGESGEETLPPTKPPPIRAPDCSFCDAKKLQNFYGPGSRGNVCCPKCFKEREKDKLAKEVDA